LGLRLVIHLSGHRHNRLVDRQPANNAESLSNLLFGVFVQLNLNMDAPADRGQTNDMLFRLKAITAPVVANGRVGGLRARDFLGFTLLVQYTKCCAVLQTELGVEPSLATQEMAQRLRDGPLPPRPRVMLVHVHA
jgi:hypothetical protein